MEPVAVCTLLAARAQVTLAVFQLIGNVLFRDGTLSLNVNVL